MAATTDIAGRPEVIRLVDRFYETVRADETLGPIFDQIAEVDWESHLPKMYNFWQTVLFREGGYKGDPIVAHANLLSKVELGRDKFDHWLALFKGTVDELFEGAHAEHIKRCAEDMANVIHGKINGIPDPRLDPSNLTPDQRARYAAYKSGKKPD